MASRFRFFGSVLIFVHRKVGTIDCLSLVSVDRKIMLLFYFMILVLSCFIIHL